MRAAERKLLAELINIMELSVEFGNLYQKLHGLNKADSEKMVRDKKKELFNEILRSKELSEYYQTTGKEFPTLT